MKHLLSIIIFGLVICVTNQANAQGTTIQQNIETFQDGNFILGDLTGPDGNPDGKVTWEDYETPFRDAFSDFITDGTYNPAADINGDGRIESTFGDLFQDVVPFADLLHFRRGDLNKDCSVDFADALLLSGEIGKVIGAIVTGGNYYNALADIDENNRIDFGDVHSIIAILQGQTVPTIVERAFRLQEGDPGYDPNDNENALHRCTLCGERVSNEFERNLFGLDENHPYFAPNATPIDELPEVPSVLCP